MGSEPKTPQSSPKSGQLWGGRFERAPDQTFFEFNRSFGFDYRLIFADIQASQAHVAMLREAKILTPAEAAALDACLEELRQKVMAKPELLSDPSIEDVHSFIEAALTSSLGDLGKKVHTGRSRNDQVATALRLWLSVESVETQAELKELLGALLALAETHEGLPMPAYTHMQKAQPVLFSHWVLAYAEMFRRDLDRITQAQPRLKTLPLGSGALAGAGFTFDRSLAQKALGFDSISRNSIDAVSDRDFVIDWMSFASLVMMHLSRLSEDLIVYATHEFGFIKLDDEISSGSSLMPQKKNPDSLELIRGKFGRVAGALSGMLSLMKGLPTAYNKDLQEDKEALFDCVDTVRVCLKNMTLILKHVHPQVERMKHSAETGFMNATDLADLAVQKGVPFREAHERAGKLVRLALQKGVELSQLGPADVKSLIPELDENDLKRLTAAYCIDRKGIFGGTNQQRVQAAILEFKDFLKKV